VLLLDLGCTLSFYKFLTLTIKGLHRGAASNSSLNAISLVDTSNMILYDFLYCVVAMNDGSRT
jgi:hypothetical protein